MHFQYNFFVLQKYIIFSLFYSELLMCQGELQYRKIGIHRACFSIFISPPYIREAYKSKQMHVHRVVITSDNTN